MRMSPISPTNDRSVPPTMRALGLALQDLFVPRSSEPCHLEPTTPPHLESCLHHLEPWRARIKGQSGDCRVHASRLIPLVWAPSYYERRDRGADEGGAREVRVEAEAEEGGDRLEDGSLTTYSWRAASSDV